MQRVVIFFLLLLMLSSEVLAQVDTSFMRQSLRYRDYMTMIGQQHLPYAAARYNVRIAAANVESAKVFSDPVLSVGYFNNQHWVKELGYGVNAGLGHTLLLGGKRAARIRLAKDALLLAEYQLSDFFQQLRAEATLAYLEALKESNIQRVNIASYQTLRRLADADSIRYRMGIITASDAKQSKLEAGIMLNDVYAGAAVWRNSLGRLHLLLGRAVADTFFIPEGDMRRFERDMPLAVLIAAGLDNRADLLAARQEQEVARRGVQVAISNRVIDLGLSAGLSVNAAATNETAPTPAYKALSVGVSVPLKLSNRYRGELHAARYVEDQRALAYRQVGLQVEMEVRAAYATYRAARQQVLQFDDGLLDGARQLLEGKIYSYQRGESSLLEVLHAQRTYNEVQQRYYETLNSYAGALVLLERSAGIWDISF